MAVSEQFDYVMLCDGFKEALIGIAEQYHRKPIAVYDRNKIIEILAKDMSYEEAEEYFGYNIFQAWVGEQSPMFVSPMEEYDLEEIV